MLKHANIVIVCLSLLFGAFVWTLYSDHMEMKRFEEAHSPAKIIGKTFDEITGICGNPRSIERHQDGTIETFTYKDIKVDEYCSIQMDNGVATRVVFEGQ